MNVKASAEVLVYSVYYINGDSEWVYKLKYVRRNSMLAVLGDGIIIFIYDKLKSSWVEEVKGVDRNLEILIIWMQVDED